jgi:hypothetical protein
MAISLVVVFLFSNILSNRSEAHSSVTDWTFLPLIIVNREVLFEAETLEGYDIFGECNPGGGTVCACDPYLDAALEHQPGYSAVISNPRRMPTYVNAIAGKRFQETFPNGEPLALGRYLYQGEFRLPVMPAQDVTQTQNSQGVHMMIMLWDGRNTLYPADGRTLEGSLYWELNPWDSDYGWFKAYTNFASDPEQLFLEETGIQLPPDTLWHSFEVVVDLESQTYISVRIDDHYADLRHIDLAKRAQPSWGLDVSLIVTAESMATWPKSNCAHVFTWTTYFRNVLFSRY